MNLKMLINVITLTVSLFGISFACTYVEVPYDIYGEKIIGRTMELEFDFLEKAWSVQVVPKGWQYKFNLLPDFGEINQNLNRTRSLRTETSNSSDYGTTKYGFVAIFGGAQMGGQKLEVVTDGMNEFGVSFSANTFRLATYQEGTEAEANAEVRMQFIQMGAFVLGSFKSAKECIESLKSGKTAIVSPSYIPDDLKVHFAIADAESSFVVEYIDGKLNVHYNQVGILTNDPEFPFHLKHLSSYSAISPENPNPSASGVGPIDTEVGQVPYPYAHGFNTLGLPGDYTPASRFVKMFYLKQLAEARSDSKPKSEVEGIRLATALINAVAIPKGVVAKMSQFDWPEFTQWGTLKAPSSKKFMFRNYFNNQWRLIDLTKLESILNGTVTSKPRALPVYDSTDGIADITSEFGI